MPWEAKFQKRPDYAGILPHIQYGNDRGYFRLDGKVDAEVGPADDGPAEVAMFLGKLLRVPLDPGHRLPEPAEEFIRPSGEPGGIEVPRVVEVVLDRLQELDRLAFHDRARRRSNSGRVIRFTLPDW